jgi:hypothetical protein
MSRVTNILLHVDGEDEALTMPSLQGRLVDAGIGELGDLCDSREAPARGHRWGGTKYPEVNLYGAAYNHLDLEQFMALLAATAWREPDTIQLFVCQSDSVTFAVYALRGGAWTMLVPPLIV